jgi:diacylglycerol kinase (ATP)
MKARAVGSTPQHLTSVAVVLNPRSAGGRTGGVWPRVHARLEEVCGALSVFETQAPGHAIELTGQALAAGHRTLIAVGGDGTLNEVVNGILNAEVGDRDVVLGLIPQGTGSDFRRTAGIPLAEGEAIEVIRRGRTARVDAMRVAYRTPEGDTRTRYAINLTSFGMGGRVAARVNRSRKPAGARVAFLTATAVTAAGFAGDSVAITLDGDDGSRRFDMVITNVAVGNGQYHGSGMHVCPRARLDDGLLDVTIIEHLSLLEIARNFRLLFNGRIYDHPKIHHHLARRLVADSESDAAIEIDGEALGYLPVEVTALPGAVRMLFP